ncbi:hypothetical protein AUJ66_05200 [Candidatus Desantisbacteria bacterium CG1_02_38_46]|uniref:V-ATPase subunit E n=1 Tax=Candidatus Desantisbacteria bacterium CG1_02_38_46 TaxID=1817893 RepID=A0A1J4SBJ7_9BACT|nr:MAG: hypothetical protein AUJ66_05200 [Candidatus Desantisbacteria bacterium CG1_02_38_46]
MSIEAIIDKIIGDARREAEKIRTEAQEKVDEIEKMGRSNIKDTCSRILQKSSEESKQKIQRLKIASNMEFRKGELEEKQAAISLAFDLALKEIQNLGKVEYQKLIEDEFLNAEGVEEVIIPPDEKRVDEEFLTKINKLLTQKGKKGNLKLSNEKRSIPGGGFMLKKGNVYINNAFNILLESIRNQIELKISEILF